jgi:phage portal protein BeeE
VTPLSTLRRQGPRALKLSFGGGQGFDAGPFWSRPDVFTSGTVGAREAIGTSFEEYVSRAYKANGIVFACIQARALPFSEARFMHQRMDAGTPGELVWSPSLALLDRPWRNGTTGELLYRMEQEASLAGNSYWTPVGDRLRRMRPDWVTIVTGVLDDDDASPYDLDADILAYIYHPKAVPGKRRPDPVLLTPDRVAHYSPTPDPDAQWRGMSWLTPVLREIEGDSAATEHKRNYFRNGTTSNVVVTYDKGIPSETVRLYAAMFGEQYQGVDKAYKTIHLGGGADIKTVGADMKQLDFKVTQGAGETRIAAAAGVGAIIARFSEGMQGSSLNQGNYGAAKRQFADMTIRPLWRIACASLEHLAPGPQPSRLWFDTTDIEFLKEDRKDAADIVQINAVSVRQLVEAGFTADSAVKAVTTQDMSLLVHTGKTSVQLHDPNDVPVDPQP